MIEGIHHVQITIPSGDEDAARAFYCGVLCMLEIEKPQSLRQRGGLWVQAGSGQMHIGTESGVDRHQTKAHIAWQVSELPVWHERLTAHGIEILDGIPIPGYDRFEFRDPFGNRVELIEPVQEQR